MRPLCIVTAQTSLDVRRAVRVLAFLNEKNGNFCPFAIRSGGHSKAGSSTQGDGINIDLSALNTVSVSEDGRIAGIGPGARWKDVYLQLDGMGLTVPGGRHGGVGVGGLSLTGEFAAVGNHKPIPIVDNVYLLS